MEIILNQATISLYDHLRAQRRVDIAGLPYRITSSDEPRIEPVRASVAPWAPGAGRGINGSAGYGVAKEGKEKVAEQEEREEEKREKVAEREEAKPEKVAEQGQERDEEVQQPIAATVTDTATIDRLNMTIQSLKEDLEGERTKRHNAEGMIQVYKQLIKDSQREHAQTHRAVVKLDTFENTIAARSLLGDFLLFLLFLLPVVPLPT